MATSRILFAIAFLLGMMGLTYAEDPSQSAASAPVSSTLDMVTLKDGSVVYGRVLGMVADELHIKTAFGVGDDIVKIMWPNVAKLVVNRPVPFNLKEGTVIVGTAQAGEPGTLLLNALPTGTVMTVPLDSVVGVNQPSVIYMGAIQAGFSQAAGNSHLRNGSLIGELTARGESLRLTLLGRYIYGDDQGTLLVRNSREPSNLISF